MYLCTLKSPPKGFSTFNSQKKQQKTGEKNMAIEVIFPGNKKVDALIDGYTVQTDQPVQAGGDGTAPTPFALFIASMGACAGIYVKGFCDQRGISTGGMHLSMDYDYDPAQKMIARFILQIHVPVDFPAQYDDAVIRAASLCAVKRHLNPAIESRITIIRDVNNQ